MKGRNFFFAVLAGCSAVLAADWPQYRGPGVDGKSAEKLPQRLPEAPRARWKAPTPNGFSSFAVAGGRAYTVVLREVDGVNREVLLALNSDTGHEAWSAALSPGKYENGGDSGTARNSGGDGPRATPAVDGERVYVLGSDLVLACFEAATGKPAWRRDLVKENGGRNISWKSAASPVIEGGLVLVAAGGEKQALLGINKATGAVVWKAESDAITHATPVPATIHGIRQIIFYTQKGLVAVQPEDGKVLWRHPVRYSVSTAASPVVAGDIVYCSAGYGVGATAVEISKTAQGFRAAELWKVTGNSLANHWSTPVEKDGYLYGMFQFKQYGDGPLKCVELRTGKVLWSEAGFGPGNVILVGGDLVVLGDAGQVAIVEPSPKGYQEKARFQAVTGKCWSTPGFADGVLYVRSTREGAAYDLSAKLTRK